MWYHYTLSVISFDIQITRVLLEEYPKLRDLRGGWLLQKAAGEQSYTGQKS
jgi:hypothetical protein